MENHGRRSGGCQPHPHCQLLGMPLVPGEQTELYDSALNYWRRHQETCVFEAIAAQCLSHVHGDLDKDRHLLINDHVMAFIPHAQERKNEIWIMPKRQCQSFALASVEEAHSLALAARSCLGMLYAAHDDPDYNILMRSAPSRKYTSNPPLLVLSRPFLRGRLCLQATSTPPATPRRSQSLHGTAGTW